MRRNVSQRNLQIARRAAEEINLYLEDSFNFIESLAGMLMPVQDPWVADVGFHHLVDILLELRLVFREHERGTRVRHPPLSHEVGVVITETTVEDDKHGRNAVLP